MLDQHIEEIPDGVILNFNGAQYGKVLELVLAQGRDALPLEPLELVEDWQTNLRDMQKRARGRHISGDVLLPKTQKTNIL